MSVSGQRFPHQSRRSRRVLPHLLVVLAFFVLSIALTYPLIANFTSHVVGRNIDEATFVWNLWWVKHALVDLRSSPLFTDFIFYPLGISLVYYTLTLFNGLFAMPLLFFTSPIVANNTVYLLSLTLSGYGTFLLAGYLLDSYVDDHAGDRFAVLLAKTSVARTLAPFVAGLVFAFSSSQFVYASLGQPNLTSTAWIPLYALYLIKTVREGSWRNLASPCLAGLFLLFAVTTELTYAAFLLVFTALYLAAAFASLSRNWRGLARLSMRLGVLMAVFLAGFAPVLVSALQEIAAEGEYMSAGWGYGDAYSSDLLGFFIPTYLHPVFGNWAKEAANSFTDINIVYIGYAVMALAGFAAIRFWRTVRFWALSALLYFILTLGPILHVNGVSTFDFDGLKTSFPLPYILLHYLPLVKATRIPNRFSVMLFLALAVLVAFAVAWAIGEVQSRLVRTARGFSAGLAVVFSAAILFESLSVPLPLNNMVAPEVYRQIAADPADVAVMPLPLGWRNSYGMLGSERTIVQSYQAVHNKKILGGNISRNPDFKFAYFAGVPFLRTVAAMEEGKPLAGGQQEQDSRLAGKIAALYNVRYVVVHRQYVKPEVEEYVARALLLEKFYERDGVVGYKVPVPAPTVGETIDFGSDGSAAYRGEGWSGDETIAGQVTVNWAVRQEARVFFAVYGKRDIRLSLRMIPFVYGGMPEQKVMVIVNGKEAAQLELEPDWRDYEVDVPASMLKEGLNELKLRFPGVASPNKVLPGYYEIGRTGTRSPVDLTIQSAGMNAGNYAYIKVGGKESGRNARGYNLVAVDPNSGKVIQSAAFDTFAGEAQADRLAAAIEALPAGTIVALAAKDDASQKLTARAWQAIESLGGANDVRGKYRWSHALLGVKGARSGTAAEAFSEQPAFVHVGANPDTRSLAAAVDYVKIEAR